MHVGKQCFSDTASWLYRFYLTGLLRWDRRLLGGHHIIMFKNKFLFMRQSPGCPCPREVDQASLELTELILPCPLSAGIKGVKYYTKLEKLSFMVWVVSSLLKFFKKLFYVY